MRREGGGEEFRREGGYTWVRKSAFAAAVCSPIYKAHA